MTRFTLCSWMLFICLIVAGVFGTASSAFADSTSIKYGWIALDANKMPILAQTQHALPPNSTNALSKPVSFISNGVTVKAVPADSVVYLANNRVGKAQALIIGSKIIGFKDAFITTFTVIESIPLSQATVSPISDYKYTGKEIKPTPIVTVNGQVLAKDKDYTLSYVNHVKAGMASVIITGKGNYTGSATKTFTIKPVEDKTLRLSKTTAIMLEGQKKITIKATIGSRKIPAKTSVAWSTTNKSVATVDKNGKVTAKKKGTCYITCTISDKNKSTARCKVTVKSGKDIVKEARKALGKKYVKKGHNWDTGMSCSGLVGVVYKRVLGVDWEPKSHSHWLHDTNKFKTIKTSQLQPGDILVRKFPGTDTGHVGIWTGNSIIEENAGAGKCIETKDAKDVKKWKKKYTARRYVG